MIDYSLVDEAPMFPHACFLCGGQEKPLLDGVKEVHGNHIYVCKMCARRIAQTFGFAESAELDRLMNTRQSLDAATREISERVVALSEKDKEIRDLHNTLGSTNEALEYERGRANQLQARLDQVRQDTLSTLEATK
jgi:hypothetical protein